ncbi:hypothetical protein J3Q64DRAFT_1699814 [Phycomyces blakesleeanus]|uniref:F-box domain-containing protein n=1 Tax=Phycomyces blakesleeanus TaxID=4837 RepID=A0ABR3AXT3_PHYBL
MLPSELPIEILSQIAEHLSKKDKALCALACKRWKVPFQESFWKNISAQSIEELCEICTIPKDSLHENPYALVKSLAVGGKSTFTAWLECGIFQIFSSLTHLDVRCLHIQTVDVYDANRSDSFRSLKEMEQQKVISFISQFPNLEEVNIYSYDGQRILTFTTSDIDTIHNNLPHLKSVKGRFSLDDIDQDTIDNLQNTIPALSVTSLDLIITKKDCIWSHYLWLCYFNHKYPNLRRLKLRLECDENKFNFEEYHKRKGLVSCPIVPGFTRLERFTLYTNDSTKLSNAFFWDFFYQSRIYIKHLTYKNFARISNIGFLERSTPYYVYNFIRTDFSCYSLLVNLEVKCRHISIDLDNLLDSCTGLRQLRISRGKLHSSNSQAYKDKAQHGLQTLELDNTVVITCFFNHLSFRCRYLELIKLTRLQICGIISEETKGVSIDMPYTKTQKLIFDRVQFYSSTEHLNERTKINLILMSQLTEASQSDENEETAGVESSMSYICWLHRFKETENVNNFTQWYRELSDQDCQEILAYYHKSSYKKKNIGTQEVRKGFGRKTTKKFWEDDLGRGYVEWVCSPLVDNNDSLSRLKDSNFYNPFARFLPLELLELIVVSTTPAQQSTWTSFILMS